MGIDRRRYINEITIPNVVRDRDVPVQGERISEPNAETLAGNPWLQDGVDCDLRLHGVVRKKEIDEESRQPRAAFLDADEAALSG